jgi:NADPH:quinone reductase-like Zn-dependent oxidoreductase
VLVLGTGGVSLLALQLARALGARVAITSRSREKLARIAHLGPDLAVCTADDADWSRTVATWAGDGVDLVVEVAGGDTLDASLRAVRTGGTIALIGVLGGGVATVRLARIFMRGIRVQGVFVGHRADFGALCAFLARHPELRPTIDGIVPFQDADLAVRRLGEGSHVGKLVVRLVAG